MCCEIVGLLLYLIVHAMTVVVSLHCCPMLSHVAGIPLIFLLLLLGLPALVLPVASLATAETGVKILMRDFAKILS